MRAPRRRKRSTIDDVVWSSQTAERQPPAGQPPPYYQVRGSLDDCRCHSDRSHRSRAWLDGLDAKKKIPSKHGYPVETEASFDDLDASKFQRRTRRWSQPLAEAIAMKFPEIPE